MTPILKYGSVSLLNLPGASEVADEVITRDVYKASSIPANAPVLDIGAFYGEFALLSSYLGHRTIAYEPSHENAQICRLNLLLNGAGVRFVHSAISDKRGVTGFAHNPEHPASSKLDTNGLDTVSVEHINDVVASFGIVAIKLDAEGSEKEILDAADLTPIRWLAMEWHNCDGDYYKAILEKAGFTVTMSCDGGASGGIITAMK